MSHPPIVFFAFANDRVETTRYLRNLPEEQRRGARGASPGAAGGPSGHTSGVYAAAFSPDGTRVVTASEDKTARLWNTTTGQAIAT